MALITLPPKVYFETVESLTLMRSGLSLRSRYTGKRQDVNFPFALWKMKAKMLAMSGVPAGQWRRFLVQMQGQKNTFKLPVPGTEAGPLSGYSGPMGFAGSGAAGSMSIGSSGWTAYAAILAEGDFFTVNDELKVATAAVAADSSGNATVAFEPFLRQTISGSPQFYCGVGANQPYCIYSGSADDSATWGLSAPVEHAVTLDLIEAVET